MTELWMLIGPPGSGKSTYIKRNAKQVAASWVVISSDDILEELAQVDGITYQESFKKYTREATQEMFRRAETAIQNNQNVIWDQTNMNIKSRRKKLGMFPETYVKTAFTFVVTDKVLAERLAQREKETGKYIPKYVVENMQRSYQAPSKEEGFNKIQYVRD